MKIYKVTLDDSYGYATHVIEANNILHLLSIANSLFEITGITKIELMQ